MARLSILAAVAVLLSAQAASAAEGECDLTCRHGGVCARGFKDHGAHEAVSTDLYFTKEKEKRGMHCVCPEGFAGVQCEVKLDKCGTSFCYHGATCIHEPDPDFGGSGKRFCDCTTATDLLDSSKLFAGKFCEYKATKVCSVDEGKLPHFCANGGKCSKVKHQGCECPDGYSGPFCEFQGNSAPKCELQCKHGGECRHGVNYAFESGALQKKFDLGDAFDQGQIDFQYCSCPAGFYGIDCSLKVKKCGPDADPEHVCANGGECVAFGKKENGIKWGCECPAGTWAGQHCENPANQLCVISGDPIEAGEKGAFCTNGGTCVEFVDKKRPHAECDCPIGFHGSKCQYKNGAAYVAETTKKSKSSESSMGAAGTFVIVVVAIGCILIAGVMVMRSGIGGRISLASPLKKSPTKSIHDTFSSEDNLSPARSLDDDGEFKEVHMI